MRTPLWLRIAVLVLLLAAFVAVLFLAADRILEIWTETNT